MENDPLKNRKIVNWQPDDFLQCECGSRDFHVRKAAAGEDMELISAICSKGINGPKEEYEKHVAVVITIGEKGKV